ncbi:hypothetical protein [Motilimonas sp. KMU-193]|uniref:hypothetical protein n=1 Tax=Motilimonas sp. KMU-193 TaxID=3388668 RepID=UPI00396B1273
MNLQQHKALLAAILNNQQESHKYYIAYERLEQALTSGPELSQQEQEIVWLSPATRRKFIHIKKQLAANVERQWQDQTWQAPQTALAAGGRDENSYTRKLQGFTLELYRNDLGWDLVLKIAPQVSDTLMASTEVWLEDDQGEEWIKGIPDTQGYVYGEWETGDRSIADILNRPIQLKHN